MVSVYVSSTYRDLGDYRRAVIAALRDEKHHVLCMEDYGATDARPIDKCLRDVDQCDVYVGIFAWLYGHMPEEDNPAGRSITELEYRRAKQSQKTCLIFLLQEDQAWSPVFMENGTGGVRLKALRDELRAKHVVSFFRREEDLANHVVSSLRNHLVELDRKPKSPAARAEQAEGAKPDRLVLPPGLQRALTGHADAVECVAISPDARKAASGSWDKKICVWDLDSGRLLAKFEGHTGTLSHPGIVYKVAFSPDGASLFSCGRDGTIRIWDIAIARQLRKLDGHSGGVESLALSGNGRVLVTGGTDRAVRVWDLQTYRPVHTFTGHRGPVRGVAVSADGDLALSAGADGQLKLWDLACGKEIPRFKPMLPLFSVDLAADGSVALTSDIDGNIRLWRVDTGIEVRSFSGHNGAVRDSVMSRDLRRMVSGGNDGTVRLWDLSSGVQLARFDEHGSAVVATAVSEDAAVAVTGGVDKVVRVWRLPQ
jgi:WD40 repeat protein